jgi:hypothetical protein
MTRLLWPSFYLRGDQGGAREVCLSVSLVATSELIAARLPPPSCCLAGDRGSMEELPCRVHFLVQRAAGLALCAARGRV